MGGYYSHVGGINLLNSGTGVQGSFISNITVGIREQHGKQVAMDDADGINMNNSAMCRLNGSRVRLQAAAQDKQSDQTGEKRPDDDAQPFIKHQVYTGLPEGQGADKETHCEADTA